jgi:hypothetical protein
MNKVAYNTCYGGFTLSTTAQSRLKELGVSQEYWEVPRHHPQLIQVLEELGLEAASGDCSKIKIFNIHEDKYRIREFDGKETVEEYYGCNCGCYGDWINI